MIWGLALYPTVIGYLFLRRWNYTRFEIPHDSGYHVLFKSIIAGMVLFAVPYLIATELRALLSLILSARRLGRPSCLSITWARSQWSSLRQSWERRC